MLIKKAGLGRSRFSIKDLKTKDLKTKALKTKALKTYPTKEDAAGIGETPREGDFCRPGAASPLKIMTRIGQVRKLIPLKKDGAGIG